MKTTFLKTLVCACVALGAVACSDIDDLRRDVDDLEHRVTALETQIQQLNDNVAALQTLMNGTTINSVTVTDGVYTVTLSNGEVLTITQGSEGGYIEPKVAIDEEGYWIISVNNDGVFERMKDSEGNDVLAVAQAGKPGNDGNDGTTPKFRVDSENYWQVSYDGGTTWEYVLNGTEKVKADTAAGTQDAFFADVKVEGDKLVLTLLDGGTSYEIPIYAGFKCMISGASSVVDFDYNATKTFDVDMDGVETTIVTAPEGWEADLAAKTGGGTPAYTLTVAAPASDAAKTRAAADSRTDVSILAVASNGLSTIAKLRVKLTGMVLHTPTVKSVTVDADKTTETSLTFSVETDDATGWKYICQPSADTAPDAAKVMTDGKDGAAGANTVTGLTKNTAYTIYVVAHDDGTPGTLETKEARTLKGITDYYEEGVTLGGVTYDKNTSGAQLITAAETISTNGVYFIDVADGVEITLDAITTTELVLIGRHSDKYPKVKVPTGPILLGGGQGFILKNIELDSTPYADVLLKLNSGVIKNLIFEDCRIDFHGKNKHFSYLSNGSGTIENIAILNSVLRIGAGSNGQATRIINFATKSIAENGKITFENSIIYTKDYCTHGTLVHINNTDHKMPTVAISVKNCSFINFIGQPNAYFYLSEVKSVDFSKNILWEGNNYAKEGFTFRFYQDPKATLEYTDNICYGLASDNAGSWKYTHKDSVPTIDGYHDKESSDPFASTDFENGKFVSAVEGYGATIE